MTKTKEVAKESVGEVAVVEQPTNALVTVGGVQLPAFLADDVESVAGLGNSQDPNDSSLPFLGIIQSGSPQIKEEDAKFIQDSKAGFIFNTATRQFWPSRTSKGEDGIVVIPCGHTKHWVEWKPNRGGYADTHPFDMQTIKDLGAKKVKVVIEGKEREQIVLPSGNILTETSYTFLVVDGLPMVLGASSTALGAMRDWMSYRRSQRLNGKQLPAFARQYRLQTVVQTKDNNSWHNWKFTDLGFVLSADDYELAKAFAVAVAKGEVVVGRPDFFDDSEPTRSPSDEVYSGASSYDDGIDV